MFEAHTNLWKNILHSNLPYFPENAAVVSDEHGEMFHQHSDKIEIFYKGKWNPTMLADFCWIFLETGQMLNRKKHKYSKS